MAKNMLPPISKSDIECPGNKLHATHHQNSQRMFPSSQPNSPKNPALHMVGHVATELVRNLGAETRADLLRDRHAEVRP